MLRMSLEAELEILYEIAVAGEEVIKLYYVLVWENFQ